jgi:RNA recognition motif-containing protein
LIYYLLFFLFLLREFFMNIYVGNLSQAVNEDALRALFEDFGNVTSVKVITDRETGMARGFAFVDMSNQEEAQKAIDELNGREVEGQRLRVNEARERDDRRPRSNNRFGGGGSSQGRGGFGGSRSGGFGSGGYNRY